MVLLILEVKIEECDRRGLSEVVKELLILDEFAYHGRAIESISLETK